VGQGRVIVLDARTSHVVGRISAGRGTHTVLVNNFGVDGYGNCTITSWSHTGTTVPQGFYTIDLSNV